MGPVRIPRQRLTLGALGLAQGLAFWLLWKTWPQSQPNLAASSAVLVFVAAGGLVWHFAWTGAHRGRLLALAIAVATLFALVTFWVGWQLPVEETAFKGDGERIPTWGAAALLALYILGPFLQIYQSSGRVSFPYSELYRHSWNNFFIGAVGSGFAGLFWVLIVLWAELFDLIGIEFFEEVFYSEPFEFMSLSAAAGLGIAVGKESDRVIGTLRTIALLVFRALMPLLTLIAMLFLAFLPFTGLQPLWDTGHASALVLALLALTVLFTNAVFEDGQGEYPTWLRRTVTTALLASPAFALISGYSLGLRVGQYGLSPTRFFGLLAILIMSIYAVGYAAAVFPRSNGWLHAVRRVNVAVALLVAALALLTHTPLLDPLSWSARSQMARLLDERVAPEDFDYGFLHFELGRRGSAVLDELLEHRRAAEFRAGIELVRQMQHYWRWKEYLEDRAMPDPGIGVEPPGAEFPTELMYAIQRHLLGHYELKGCFSESGCFMFAVDLDDDSEDEWILSHPRRSVLFDQKPDGRWYRAGELERILDRGELREALAQGKVGAEPPRLQDLRIGDRVVPIQRGHW